MSTSLKYGKLPPEYHRDTLKMSDFLPSVAVMPPPPAKRAWEYAVKTPWQMFDNDKVGNCVIAATLHWIMAATANTKKPALFTTGIALAIYSAITGYDPAQTDSNGNNPTDNGTAWTDMLAYWRDIGIPDTAGTIHKILGWGSIGLTLSELNQGLNVFGGLLIGTAVTKSMEDQFLAKKTWDAPFSGGVQGLHGIPRLGYGHEGESVITWGAEEQGDLNLYKNYDEAYAVVTQDFLDTQGKSPLGFDVDALMAAL
jgi:hypothetical protein